VINSFVQFGLALKERANACSRPPDPSNKIRIIMVELKV
jgi:hypothetical protein